AVLRSHRPLEVDPGPRAQPAQGRDAVGLGHDVEAQLRALHLSDRQVDPVDSYAVAKLRAVLNPAHADPQEADAGLHDIADLLDDPGEHVECAPPTPTWLCGRLSPCPSYYSLACIATERVGTSEHNRGDALVDLVAISRYSSRAVLDEPIRMGA